MALDTSSTVSLRSVHTLHYETLKEKLKDRELALEFCKSAKLALENTPLTNENETGLENLTKVEKSLECEIKEKTDEIKNIDKIKDLFKEKLFVPEDDRNDNFNIEHLLLSVPFYNDNEEKVSFSYFWQKLVCFAKHYKLSHFAIKNCLDCVLQANAFELFSFIREKPFSECVETLQNLFATVETIEDSIRKLATIKRQKSQKIQSFMAQISILLMKTQPLTKSEAQNYVYEREMKKFLLNSCTPEARDQLLAHRSQAIKHGYNLSYSEMLSIVKDIESNQATKDMSTTNYSFPLLRNRNKIPNSNLYRSKSSDSFVSTQSNASKSTTGSRKPPNSNQQKIVPNIHEPRFKPEFQLPNQQSSTYENTNPVGDMGSNFRSRSNSRASSSISSAGQNASTAPYQARKSLSTILHPQLYEKHRLNHCHPYKCSKCYQEYECQKCGISTCDKLSLPLHASNKSEKHMDIGTFDKDVGYVSNYDENESLSDGDFHEDNDSIPQDEYHSNFSTLILPDHPKDKPKTLNQFKKETIIRDPIKLVENKVSFPFYLATLMDMNNQNTGMQFIQVKVPLKKHLVTVDAMIDTGSTLSLVARRFLKSFDNFYLEFNDFHKQVNGIGSKDIQIFQTVRLPLAFYNHDGSVEFEFIHEFNVIEDTPIPFEMLIGQDFLQDHVKNIDYSTKTVTITSGKNAKDKKQVELKTYNKIWKSPELIAIESKRIHSESNEIISCRLSQNNVMVEDKDNFAISKNPDIAAICMTECLTHYPYQTLQVRVMNPLKEDSVMIRPGVPIAQVTGTIDKTSQDNMTEELNLMDNKPLEKVSNSIEVFGETMSWYEFAKLQNGDEYCAKIKSRATLPDTYKVKFNVLIKTIDCNDKFVLPKVLLIKLLNKLHADDSSNHGNKAFHIKFVHQDFYRPDMGKVVSHYHRNCAKCNQKEAGASPPAKTSSSEASTTNENMLDAVKADQIDNENPKSNDISNLNKELEGACALKPASITKEIAIPPTPKPVTGIWQHPRQAWTIDVLTNLNPSKGYSSIYIFKDLYSEYRMLFPSKTSAPHEVVVHLEILIKFYGKPAMINITKQIYNSGEIVTFCKSNDINIEIKENCSVFNNMDAQFKSMIEAECNIEIKDWIYLVNHMQDFMNYSCMRFCGQELPPQTIQQGFHVNIVGIPSKIYNIDDLFKYWSKYMKLNLDKGFKQSDQLYSGEKSQSRQFFRVGEPVYVTTDYFDHKAKTWKWMDVGPYQILSIKRSKVALRDLSNPYRKTKFECLRNLQKIQSGNRIQCSEFEWDLIKNNSLSAKQLRK